MKIKLLILLFVGILNSNAQDKFPIDLDFEGLKGFPKQILETTEIKDSDHTTKEIYHFDKKGYLTKVEHYNWYDSDNDSLYLGDVTFYKKSNVKSKIAITIKHQSNDTIRFKEYNLINDSTINVYVKEYKTTLKTKTVQKLDKNNRIIKTTTEISDTINETIKLNSKTEFIYNDSELKKLIIKNDRTGDKSKSVIIINVKKDEFGNFVYREFIDENNITVYKVKRKYIYH
jgi:hypothetical protein